MTLGLLIALLLTASLSEAGDLRRGSIVPRVGPIVPHGPNIVPNPPPERFRRHEAHQGHVRPGYIFIAPPALAYSVPRECATAGYWAYHWVPTSYTQNTWAPGGFAPDGTWIDGRYEARAYASGYYQPYWVPPQTYAC